MDSCFLKYINRTPSFSYTLSKYVTFPTVVDHIAHRSIDMSALSRYYIENNFYLQKDTYDFPRFNVKARWFKSPKYRVFLSQYLGTEIPFINSYRDYENVYAKNQYLAWTLLHGNDINHIAITVKDIERFMETIKRDEKLKLATDLQVSKDKKLKQFSLQADKIEYKFPDKSTYLVPYCFVEFIERLEDREGFESENADKIFDSTKQQ